MKLSHGIKSALLDGKLRTGTSKTKKKVKLGWLKSMLCFGGYCILLPSSMADFVPRESFMQRAHCKKSFAL